MEAEARARYDAFYRSSLDDPESFWLREAQRLDWTRPPDRAFEQPDPPSFRWFPGGRTNMSVNALDRHVAAGRGDQIALITLDERGGRRSLTYAQLLAEVERVAAGLRGLGIGKGDRLTIYIPTTTEAIIAMLATVRIGAMHCVVFAGFGSGALGERVRASGSRLLLASDITYRKGRDVDLLGLVDAALDAAPNEVEHLIVLRRTDTARPPRDGELSWDEFLAAGEGQSGAAEDTLATDPAFILATSGTTAKPKLAVHTHGGYAVHIAAMGDWVMGLRQGETWWSTSDIGWVVGHSYIVYAPLMAGATTLAYEGAIDHPDPNVVWSIIERERVTGIFTSPTGIRLLMRYGEEFPRRHDLATLERLFSAGEVLNAPAWEWLQRTVFEDRIPVMDHMWQTETAGPIFGIPYGYAMLPVKPGSAGIALPGIDADIVDLDGQPARRQREGGRAHQAAVPRADRHLVGRAGALRRRLLAEGAERVLRRRRCPYGRGWLRLVRRSGRRDHQDRRSPHWNDRGRDGVPAPSGRGRSRGDRRAGRAARRGHRGLRRAARPATSRRTGSARSCSRRSGAS